MHPTRPTSCLALLLASPLLSLILSLFLHLLLHSCWRPFHKSQVHVALAVFQTTLRRAAIANGNGNAQKNGNGVMAAVATSLLLVLPLLLPRLSGKT